MAASPTPAAGPARGGAPPEGADTVTPLSGLTEAEVAGAVERGLTNDAGQGTSRSFSDILRANIVTPFNALLGALAVIVLATGAWQDALFGLIVVWNALVGIVQEVQAKRTLDQLAVLSAPRAHVTRNGQMDVIAMEEVVLGDMLQLRTGDQVVADCLLRDGDGLEVDESLLTGESEPVDKQVGDEVLSGSIIVAGAGIGQVHRVGADAFASRLTSEARAFRLTSSELVAGINRILRCVALAMVVTAPILFWSQTRSTSTWREAVRGTVAGLVGMVPEGLVLLTSVTFFAAAVTLARRRVLVRELPAVEGLARVDVLCLDKTGTLTEGEIVFAGVETVAPTGSVGSPGGDLDAALGAMAADPNANATLHALGQAHPPPEGWQRVAAVPFSSARKWSAASFADRRGTWVLGAPEIVLAAAGAGDSVRVKAEQAAAKGSRILVVALTSEPLTGDALPAGLRPVALLRFEEKIRPDAADTLRYFTEQGVALKVISGDNVRTVEAVAARVGLPGAGDAVDARELPDGADAWVEAVEQRSVFGRVTPQQKRSMVGALHLRGHVVAMTGDGVNDALALKDADIGVAMGSGAPATRAVAQIVLLDSQFGVMPGVVAEGRRVIANIERVANLFLTKNVTALVLSLSVAVARWPFPFLPRHLTMVSALAIGVPGFFLALGPNATRFETGFVRRVLSFAIPAGLIIAVSVMIAYGLARAEHVAPDKARTAATIAYTLASLWILVIQARPLNRWKVALVSTMGGLAALGFVVPAGRSFYDLYLPPSPTVLQSVALGAAAAFALELASPLAGFIRRLRQSPRPR